MIRELEDGWTRVWEKEMKKKDRGARKRERKPLSKKKIKELRIRKRYPCSKNGYARFRVPPIVEGESAGNGG